MITRRDFARGALAAAGLRAPMTGAASGMFVSLNASLTSKVAWPEFARLAARVGYGGVDTNLDAARKEGLDATRALFAELKIRPGIVSLPVPFTRDEQSFQGGLKQLGEAAAFALAIGCPRMMAVMPASSETPKLEFRKIIKDRIVAISEILLKPKVRLALEFLGPLHLRKRLPHEFIWRMDELLEFSKECGPNIGLTLDVWHWHHSGATTADIIAAGKSRIIHIHLSDAAKMPPEAVQDHQRLMPGEGVIDLVGFFQALRKIGYEDAVSPEPLGRIPQDMSPEDGARLGLETTRAVMRKALG